MQRIKLKGVKQTSSGDTIYEMVRVNSSDATVSDQTAPTFFEFAEQASAPAAPAANFVRLYAQDNGSGKTRLVAKFASGADVVIATQA